MSKFNQLYPGYSQLTARGASFYSVLDLSGNLVEVDLAYSDTFSYYYLEGAVGCAIDKNP